MQQAPGHHNFAFAGYLMKKSLFFVKRFFCSYCRLNTKNYFSEAQIIFMFISCKVIKYKTY